MRNNSVENVMRSTGRQKMVLCIFPTMEEKLDGWFQAEYHEAESRIEQCPGFAHSPLRRESYSPTGSQSLLHHIITTNPELSPG